MNIKVVKHRTSFSNTIDYAFDGKKEKDFDKVLDKKAEIVAHSENIIVPYSSEDRQGRKVMIQQFQHQNLYGKNDISKPCGHETLNFNPKDRLSDEKIEKITEDYIQKRGLTDTQYVAIKHQDTKHTHVHVIYNRTSNEGKTIDSTYEKLNAKKTGIELSAKYQLTTTEKLTVSQSRAIDSQQEKQKNLDSRPVSDGVKVKELQKDPIIGKSANRHHLKVLSKQSKASYEETQDKTLINGKEYKNEHLQGLFRANTSKHQEKAAQTKLSNKLADFKLKRQLKEDRLNNVTPKKGLVRMGSPSQDKTLNKDKVKSNEQTR